MTHQEGGDLPRLFRPSALSGTQVATLDKELNLLCIDRERFAALDEQQKRLVYRTNEASLVIEHGRVVPARLATTHPQEEFNEAQPA